MVDPDFISPKSMLLFFQWIFQVPVKGGLGIIYNPPRFGKDYKWYISGIFPANWGMGYAIDFFLKTSHVWSDSTPEKKKKTRQARHHLLFTQPLFWDHEIKAIYKLVDLDFSYYILLMEEILQQLIGSLSHYLQG